MYYIGVDLGSTNIKVALYTQDMKLVNRQSYPVDYIRKNGFVEFDADKYFKSLTDLIASMIQTNKIPADQVAQITLTGQAEFQPVLGSAGIAEVDVADVGTQILDDGLGGLTASEVGG